MTELIPSYINLVLCPHFCSYGFMYLLLCTFYQTMTFQPEKSSQGVTAAASITIRSCKDIVTCAQVTTTPFPCACIIRMAFHLVRVSDEKLFQGGIKLMMRSEKVLESSWLWMRCKSFLSVTIYIVRKSTPSHVITYALSERET